MGRRCDAGSVLIILKILIDLQKICLISFLVRITIVWLLQVIFHIATMMPNRDNDPKCYKKLRHIGNDFVAIVYNNAGDGSNYKLGTVKGQFIYACVVITPLDEGSNRVEIVCRPELNEPLGHVKVLYTKLSYSIFVKFN